MRHWNLNYLGIISRVVWLKDTKEKGYFVTLWEKDINEQNTPLHFDQMSDYLMIYVNDQAQKAYLFSTKKYC